MNYYEHHIGDYDEATAHLTAVEDGIYSRLLRKYYATEKPLEPDLQRLKRLVRARTREEKSAVDAVLAEFFFLADDGWHQKTCDEVIAEYVAGEPEREQKRINKDTRLKRHRLIRAAFFDALRQSGQHPAWDMKTEALRDLVKRSGFDPEALAANATATLPDTKTATAPATPATATQTPVTSTQSPVPTPQSPKVKPVGAAEPPGNGEGTQPSATATAYGLVAKALRQAGIQASPGHQRFRLLVDAGATVEEFLAFADKAKATERPFEYLLGCVEGERKRATKTSAEIRHGPMAAQVDTATRNAEAKRLLGFGKPATPETPATAQEALDA